MKANENIVKRIVELTAPAVAETEATVERVVQDGFTTLYARARGQGGATRSATTTRRRDIDEKIGTTEQKP